MLNGDLSALVLVLGGAIALAAWLAFAEHPTARNFRRAVVDTLSLV